MKKILTVMAIIMMMAIKPVFAQSELMDLLSSTEEPDEGVVTATFKSTRLLNGQSIETRTKGVLEFVIGHRFGRINDGISQLYGLDQAFVRFALEYGITDQLNVGLGRSSNGKVLDSFLKYKFLKQSNSMPVTLTGFTSLAIDTREYQAGTPEGDNFNFRMDYTYQLLLARKFNSEFSLQVMPTMVHRNFAPGNEDNDVFILGAGARYKITNRLAVDVEYFHQFRELPQDIRNAVAVGVEIETGGHVFQLIFSNAVQMIEKGFLTETNGNFWDGDIHFGFNISRVFNLRPHKEG
ncbi:MAG: DUF5777 family beta-barrel protein [Bacteroidota bacterium]